jgi:hypothetical protein
MGSVEVRRAWVKAFALIYYPALGLMLYDLFTAGLRSRGIYLFTLSVLSVSGLHIAWRREDKWVNRWFISNAIALFVFNLLNWVRPPLDTLVVSFQWEKVLHAGLLSLALIAFGLSLIYSAQRQPDELAA